MGYFFKRILGGYRREMAEYWRIWEDYNQIYEKKYNHYKPL